MSVYSKKKIAPTLDRVLLKRQAQEETVAGGIILPESAKKKPELAEIIAVGPGKKDKEGKLQEVPFTVGTIVLIDKYAGQEISLDDQEYMIVKSEDIVAIVE